MTLSAEEIYEAMVLEIVHEEKQRARNNGNLVTVHTIDRILTRMEQIDLDDYSDA